MVNHAVYDALKIKAQERISEHPVDVDQAVQTGLRQLRIRMFISYTAALAAVMVLGIAAVAAHFAATADAQLITHAATSSSATTETSSTPSSAPTTPTTTTRTSTTSGATPPTLTAIRITPTELTLAMGSTQQLAAAGIYSDGSTADITSSVTWTSENPGVATVDNSGLVTAVDPSLNPVRLMRTAIRATTTSRSAAVVITLEPHNLTGIILDPSAIQSCAGSYTIAAKGTYSDGTTVNLSDIQWASDNADFVSVDQQGQVTIAIPRPNPTYRAAPLVDLRAVITATTGAQTAKATVTCLPSETSTNETTTTSTPTMTTTTSTPTMTTSPIGPTPVTTP